MFRSQTNGNMLMYPARRQVMFDYTYGLGFLIQWKNCQVDEDCNGQRMLYSQSADASRWTGYTSQCRHCRSAAFPSSFHFTRRSSRS